MTRKHSIHKNFSLIWPQILSELKEYATEVDVDFVRKAVRAIGRCAILIESAAERCTSVLLELIGTKVNYVVQEAIVVIKDIFRRYPNQYEGVIGTLCDSLDSLDEPEAKASMIWIIGEYAERIENSEELLEAFVRIPFVFNLFFLSLCDALGSSTDTSLMPIPVPLFTLKAGYLS